MRITLLQRPGPLTADSFGAILEAATSFLKGGLSASARLAGFSKTGWARVDVQGEDSEVLTELISRKLGLARTELSDIEMHGSYQGIVSGEVDGGLQVDIGIETSGPLNVRVGMSSLRAQLTDGKAISEREILESYCLIPSSKVAIRITRLEPKAGIIEGWLADSQVELFSEWIKIRLDRIQVVDCSPHELESAIRKADLKRDIISAEPMTLTMHSVLCKLGTDAIGLIPKLGSILRKRQLKPFIPKRILARCRQW